jgi:hypothetical protein
LSDGWHTITPQLAEQLAASQCGRQQSQGQPYDRSLLRSSDEGRRLDARTGQPIILSDQEVLPQHRAWAGYLSGTPFDSYVVTNVPHFETGDDSREAIDAGSEQGVKNKHVDRATPAEVLTYATANPMLAEAAHLQIGEYKAATKLIGYADIAVFAACKILESFGQEMLDHFMSDLGSSEPLDEGNPIPSLRKKFTENKSSPDPMPKRHALGYLTKVFSAWRLEQPMRRLFLKTDEKWPLFKDTSVDVAA